MDDYDFFLGERARLRPFLQWPQGLRPGEELDFWLDGITGKLMLKYYHPDLERLVKTGTKSGKEIMGIVSTVVACSRSDYEDPSWWERATTIRDALLESGRQLVVTAGEV